MQDVIGRVKALIARTSSSHEEEARTAALQACRIIREHGLVVTLPAPMPENGQRVHAPPPPPPAPHVSEERVRRVERAAWNFFDGFGRFISTIVTGDPDAVERDDDGFVGFSNPPPPSAAASSGRGQVRRKKLAKKKRRR